MFVGIWTLIYPQYFTQARISEAHITDIRKSDSISNDRKYIYMKVGIIFFEKSRSNFSCVTFFTVFFKTWWDSLEIYVFAQYQPTQRVKVICWKYGYGENCNGWPLRNLILADQIFSTVQISETKLFRIQFHLILDSNFSIISLFIISLGAVDIPYTIISFHVVMCVSVYLLFAKLLQKKVQ